MDGWEVGGFAQENTATFSLINHERLAKVFHIWVYQAKCRHNLNVIVTLILTPSKSVIDKAYTLSEVYTI